MGIGRFAYTPMFAVMRHQAGLTDALGGFVASANLAGYLVGALGASAPVFRRHRLATARWALTASALTTLAMAVPSLGAWFLLRALSGIASGFAFVAFSSLVLDRAAAEGHRTWAPRLYAGVGTGIALTGLLTPPFVALGGWQGGWIGLGVVAVAGAAFAAIAVADAPTAPAPPQSTSAFTAPRKLYPWLLTSYAAQGFGYIVPATFLVALVAGVPALAPGASLTWIVVGLVGIPSTLVWNRIALRSGSPRTIVWAQLFQALGTVMPVVEPNAFGVGFAAIALGGTFMGITSLANSTARAMFPHGSHGAIGILTAAYGVGQILGPLVTSVVVLHTHSYNLALTIASATLLVGSATMIAGTFLTRGRIAAP